MSTKITGEALDMAEEMVMVLERNADKVKFKNSVDEMQCSLMLVQAMAIIAVGQELKRLNDANAIQRMT